MTESEPMPNSDFTILDLEFQGLKNVIAAFLIETSDGVVLVESGPHSCWPTLVKSLKRYGLKPEDIKHVLLTHIHLDHAGAAWALARTGARIHVHPAGLKHMHDPSRLMASARRIYTDQMDSLWGEMHPIPLTQLIEIEDAQALKIGNTNFMAHHTPGHAIHHIAWQMEDILFTGDVAGIRIGNGVISPPCPPPEFDLEAWKSSINRMRALPVEQLVLTHFGPVADKNSHLDDLELALDQWVNFFYQQPDLENQASLVVGFSTFIHQEFYDDRMDSTLEAQYDKANPPWMSVAGITRYLNKKRERGELE